MNLLNYWSLKIRYTAFQRAGTICILHSKYALHVELKIKIFILDPALSYQCNNEGLDGIYTKYTPPRLMIQYRLKMRRVWKSLN